MGQSLKKLSSGHDDKKIKEIANVINKRYTALLKVNPETLSLADFYRAVSETVEEINKTFGNTQFLVPDVQNLKSSFENAHQNNKQPVTEDEFKKIIHDIIFKDTRFTGVGGAKDTLIYIFGVPLTAFLIKQGLFPRAVRNEIFIPGVTSATVFALAKLNKI